MEQQIKLIVRNRKNAGFFKTSVGADVGDVFTYFNTVQRYADKVKQSPDQWLPWNYEQELESLND